VLGAKFETVVLVDVGSKSGPSCRAPNLLNVQPTPMTLTVRGLRGLMVAPALVLGMRTHVPASTERKPTATRRPREDDRYIELPPLIENLL
jgi:hypothetical protein